jgi:hypothetical protein
MRQNTPNFNFSLYSMFTALSMRCMEKPWLQPRTTLPVQFKQGQHVGQPGAVLEGWGGGTPLSRQVVGKLLYPSQRNMNWIGRENL